MRNTGRKSVVVAWWSVWHEYLVGYDVIINIVHLERKRKLETVSDGRDGA